MSGIYIHIPFCKQACHYCDFHFSTNTGRMDLMVDMICEELRIRKNFLPEGPVKTVYFGGGTPSLMSEKSLDKILNTIHKEYRLELQELTLEANPDDLNKEKLRSLQAKGIDRLSIGIQSFNQEILSFYNRAHQSEEGLASIQMAKDAGFTKLSIDLMYGFPAKDHGIWKKDLEIALKNDPGHISSYCLTVEPKTALGNWAAKGKFEEASEDFAAEQFEILMDYMDTAGYFQYEISNFGKEGHFAIHNTNYWKGVPYLGIGPSAHSYDGKIRGANLSNNALYLKKLQQKEQAFTEEPLEGADRANEFILTSLRTIWGLDLELMKSEFGADLMAEHSSIIKKLLEEEMLGQKENILYLKRKGKFVADTIAASLFFSQ